MSTSNKVGEIILELGLDNKNFYKTFNSTLNKTAVDAQFASLKTTNATNAMWKEPIRNAKIYSNSLLGIRAKIFAITGLATYFTKKYIDASSQQEVSLKGLMTTVGGYNRSMSESKKTIDEYVSDGLVPLQNATKAYQNLVSRGYDDTQTKNILKSLKESATFARQSSLSIGEAVQSATEGLKNENSILVDNAGITKNVSRMWADYARARNIGTNSLTLAQKREAEYLGIMEATKFQMKNSSEYVNIFSGRIAKLRNIF